MPWPYPLTELWVENKKNHQLFPDLKGFYDIFTPPSLINKKAENVKWKKDFNYAIFPSWNFKSF